MIRALGFAVDAGAADASIARIDSLPPNDYAETRIRTVNAGEIDGAEGVHHMHSDGEFTVLDFVKTERFR